MCQLLTLALAGNADLKASAGAKASELFLNGSTKKEHDIIVVTICKLKYVLPLLKASSPKPDVLSVRPLCLLNGSSSKPFCKSNSNFKKSN